MKKYVWIVVGVSLSLNAFSAPEGFKGKYEKMLRTCVTETTALEDGKTVSSRRESNRVSSEWTTADGSTIYYVGVSIDPNGDTFSRSSGVSTITKISNKEYIEVYKGTSSQYGLNDGESAPSWKTSNFESKDTFLVLNDTTKVLKDSEYTIEGKVEKNSDRFLEVTTIVDEKTKIIKQTYTAFDQENAPSYYRTTLTEVRTCTVKTQESQEIK